MQSVSFCRTMAELLLAAFSRASLSAIGPSGTWNIFQFTSTGFVSFQSRRRTKSAPNKKQQHGGVGNMSRERGIWGGGAGGKEVIHTSRSGSIAQQGELRHLTLERILLSTISPPLQAPFRGISVHAIDVRHTHKTTRCCTTLLSKNLHAILTPRLFKLNRPRPHHPSSPTKTA